jgi:DNA-binding transcriptional LysR family regulator
MDMDHQWLGVELRHLAALQAIDAERSFRGAADRLGYVQSAVSQQLASLERLVGARLVERTRGHAGVELTEAGTLLLHHAGQILAMLSAARADLETLTSTAQSRLRVGTFESVGTHVIPRVLMDLATSHPGLTVETTEAPNDDGLFAAVARGDLDCAFAELPLNPGPFDVAELMSDPSVLLVAASSPLAQQPHPPTLKDIARLPLATPQNWRMTDLINQHFRNAGLGATYPLEIASNTAIQALVSTGLAAALMPRLAVDPNFPQTRVIELDGLFPARTLVLYWHRDRVYGSALAAFVAAAHKTCLELAINPLQATDTPVAAGSTSLQRLRKTRHADTPDDDATRALAS